MAQDYNDHTMNDDAPQDTGKLSKSRIALIVVIIVCAAALGVGSAMSETLESAIEPLMRMLMAVGLGAYAVANTMRMAIDWRERRYGWAAFWLLAALLLAGISIASLLAMFDA